MKLRLNFVRGIIGNIQFTREGSTQVKEISIRKKAADSKPQPLYQDLGAVVLHAGILFQIFHHYHSS